MNLELKHLAAYDYRCKLKIKDDDGVFFEDYIKTVNIKHETIEINEGWTFDFSNGEHWGIVFPLLRPLSNLTKEIEIDGKKFVPIVELAKLAYPDLAWEFDRTRAISEWNSERAYFFFNKNSFFACFFNNSIPNQLVLFQKLFEWHFDIFGLIDQGLALPLI